RRTARTTSATSTPTSRSSTPRPAELQLSRAKRAGRPPAGRPALRVTETFTGSRVRARGVNLADGRVTGALLGWEGDATFTVLMWGRSRRASSTRISPRAGASTAWGRTEVNR